ncbi:DUF998 domain-containing protein [Candidatus Gottesmanbacteria bacterium]|nr:DUF998 domain-containing protein [Candidatus Gottesmanbacteria bacterium]
MKQQYQKLLISSGIIGPIFYVVLMEILGSLWPGYNPIKRHMSELGGVESPFKNIMNVFGFMALGLFILLFSIGFRMQFKKSLVRALVFGNLIIAGSFMIIVGFFPCDAKCIDVTTIGKLHSLTSIPQSIVLPLAAIFSASLFATEKIFGKRWSITSFILGLLSMVAGPLMAVSSLHPFVGIIQRFGIGFSLLWMVVISFKLLTNLHALKGAR